MIEASGVGSTTELIAWVVIPVVIFLLSASAGAITLLIKGTNYMARTQAAQESVAETNKELVQKVSAYFEKNDANIATLQTTQAVHDNEINRLLDLWQGRAGRAT